MKRKANANSGPQAKRRKFNKRWVKTSTGAISKSLPSTSKQFTTKFLRYCDYIDLDASVGGTAVNTFRANGLFDPDLTGIGHQPRGYDEWMTLYQKYVVKKAKITVHGQLGASSGFDIQPIILGVTTGTRQVTSGSDLRDLTEARYSTFKTLNINSPAIVSQQFDLKNWKDSDIMADDAVHGTATTVPLEQFFFNVFMAPCRPTVDLLPNTVYVTVEYEVVLFDPIEPPIS